VLPVRVARSALGPDVPRTDLCITRAHALLIDGILVPVCNLINGTTVTIYEAGDLDELEYFHIMLQRHDVISWCQACGGRALHLGPRSASFAAENWAEVGDMPKDGLRLLRVHLQAAYAEPQYRSEGGRKSFLVQVFAKGWHGDMLV
jgi:hypothetical protein